MFTDLTLTESLEYNDYFNIYKFHSSSYETLKYLFQEKLAAVYAVYENETVDEAYTQLLQANEMSEYVPVVTTGDENSFYYALSKTLLGNESYFDALKVLTFFSLFENYKFFSIFLEQRKYGISFNSLACNTVRKYEKANELNIVASALFLRRPIFIYGVNDLNKNYCKMYSVVDHETSPPLFMAHTFRSKRFAAVMPHAYEQFSAKDYKEPDLDILGNYKGFFNS